MQQQNPWEMDWGGGASLPAPAPSQTPGIIYGRPKQPSALEIRRDQRADAAEMRAQEASERAARAEDRAATAAERANVKPTEDQSKTAAAAVRLQNSLNDLTTAGQRSPADTKPGVLETVAGAFGDEARGFAQSEDRQRIHNAQLDMLDAALYLATGAAYNKEQLQNTWRSHFPQLSDAPGTIEDKKKRLRAVLESAKLRAGPAAPQIDAALANLDSIFDGTQGKEIDPLTPSSLVDKALEREPSKPVFNQDGTVTRTEQDGTQSTWSSRADYDRAIAVDALARAYGDGTSAFAEAYRREFGEEPPLSDTYLINPKFKDRAADAAMDRQRQDQIADPLVRGIADTVSLGLADELAAGGKTLFEGGTMRDNLAAERGIDRADERVNPALRIGGQLAGGLFPLGRVIGRGGIPATPPRSALRMAGEGAGLGGAYAFGSAEGDLGDRFRAVPGGAAIGATVAGGLGAVANRLGARTPPAGGGGGGGGVRNVAAAARDTGIDILPADVGGPVTRGLTGAARQMFISELPIANKVAKSVEQAAEFRGRTAEQVGRALDKEDAGELVRKAANVYSQETGRTGGSLYTRAEDLAQGARVKPVKALAELDNQIAELSETPVGSALLDEMKALRSSLSQGDFSIRGIRNMRTRLREETGSRGLRGNDTDRRLKSVVEAASEDILDSLSESGNDRAAQAFRTADAFWKKRVETIDQVLEPLLGKNAPRSGEQVLGALERMASRETGDAKRLQRLMSAMPEDEVASVRSTIINRLGQGINAEEGAFSFNDFVKRWDGMSTKAKDTLFPSDTRKALDKLATVAREAKATAAYSNSSNTGRSIGAQGLFSTIVGGVAGLPAVAGAAAGQYGLGKLLTSKLFVNLLTRAPQGDVKAFTRGLSNVARRDPALAQDALGLQRFLQQTFEQTPLRAAATTDEEKK